MLRHEFMQQSVPVCEVIWELKRVARNVIGNEGVADELTDAFIDGLQDYMENKDEYDAADPCQNCDSDRSCFNCEHFMEDV